MSIGGAGNYLLFLLGRGKEGLFCYLGVYSKMSGKSTTIVKFVTDNRGRKH